MLYSQILSNERSRTDAQRSKAVALFGQVKAGQQPTVSLYDQMLLKTTLLITERGVAVEFDQDEAYFGSEFVAILQQGMNTIAIDDMVNGRWQIRATELVHADDLVMGYDQDEFAIMHLEGHVRELIDLVSQQTADRLARITGVFDLTTDTDEDRLWAKNHVGCGVKARIFVPYEISQDWRTGILRVSAQSGRYNVQDEAGKVFPYVELKTIQAAPITTATKH